MLTPGTHGSTFGGNPLAAAAALAVLRTLDDEGLLANSERMGKHLIDGLNALSVKHPHAAVRGQGRGLLCGLVLTDGVDPRGVLNAMRERGVLVSQAGDRVIRFAPPLIVKAEELDAGLAALDAVLADPPRVPR